MGAEKEQGQLGCGLMGGFFQRKLFQAKKVSRPSLPVPKKPTQDIQNPVRKSPEIEKMIKKLPSQEAEKSVKKQNRNEVVPMHDQSKTQAKRSASDAQRVSTSSSGSSVLAKDLSDPSLIVEEHKRTNGNKPLVRATSGNVMAISNIGNLRKLKTTTSPNPVLKQAADKSVDKPRRSSVDGTLGNIVRKSFHEASPKNRINPEVLKGMGNEQYRKGRYIEALDLYKQAISLDSSKASYHTNMAAALIGLGRLVEAVLKCLDALNIEPYYQRAHHRLATLYLR